MAKKIMVSILALILSVTSEPQASVYYGFPLYGSPYSAFSGSGPVVSAALTAPAAVPLNPLSGVPAVTALSQFPTFSAYSYGSSVSVQEYVPAPASLVLSSPYTAGAPYSAYDYIYRLGK